MATHHQIPDHSSSNLPILPPELISIIYDSLVATRDWYTLRTCGILSHSQVEPTRKRLFATITLRLRTQPHPVLIRDLVRRIQGLTEMLHRDLEVRKYIRTVEILDSFPVYESDWITQQACLPHLLDTLTNVRSCTFGCEVGYLEWGNFSVELRTSVKTLFRAPPLRTLSLCNLGVVPTSLFDLSVSYLYLKNVTTLPDIILPVGGGTDSTTNTTMGTTIPVTPNRLSYMNVRSMSLSNTEAAWGVMQIHASTLKLVKWRCWEDPINRNGACLPGTINFSQLPSLKKLSFRLSFGLAGRDLVGLALLLTSTNAPLSLRFLEIELLFPLQPTPHMLPEVRDHPVWKTLSDSLRNPRYQELKSVTITMTVHETKKLVNGRRESSLVDFRKAMKASLGRLLDISTFHAKLKVRSFHP